MKLRPILIASGLLSPLVLTGCHSGSQAQPTVTKSSFGYPGMKLSQGYYQQMQKMRTMNAAGGAKPTVASGPPSKP